MAQQFSPVPLALIAALALAPAPVLAQGYDLPSSPTPTSAPVYGPQDTENPRPRPIPVPTRSTPTARPSATPTAQPTQGPVVQPLPTTRPSAGQRPRPQIRREVPQARPTAAPPTELPQTSQPQLDLPTPSASRTLPTLPTATTAPTPAPTEIEEDGSLPWLWIALGALLAILAGAYVWRRRVVDGPVAVPEIERPTPAGAPVATPEPAKPANIAPIAAPPQAEAVSFAGGGLHLAFEARSITATLMNATLAYRITLSNRGQEALSGLIVGGTMVAANDKIALERQLEPPSGQVPALHQLERLEPGDVTELTGQIVVPLARLAPIRRGDKALFVPIARLRAAGADRNGTAVVAQDSVLLGLPGDGAQLGPIRLDLGPRVYSAIAQRLVAPQAA